MKIVPIQAKEYVTENLWTDGSTYKRTDGWTDITKKKHSATDAKRMLALRTSVFQYFDFLYFRTNISSIPTNKIIIETKRKIE